MSNETRNIIPPLNLAQQFVLSYAFCFVESKNEILERLQSATNKEYMSSLASLAFGNARTGQEVLSMLQKQIADLENEMQERKQIASGDAETTQKHLAPEAAKYVTLRQEKTEARLMEESSKACALEEIVTNIIKDGGEFTHEQATPITQMQYNTLKHAFILAGKRTSKDMLTEVFSILNQATKSMRGFKLEGGKTLF